MKKGQINLVDKPRIFEPEEMFFSTTDKKGLIRSWNEVFARVADYTADQLRNQPHNLVRHPDMPRCVFKLLWDYLGADKPIGAYVKNLASTGEYYWVFALASSHPDGYLSIRIKPTSSLLPIVEETYNALLKCEKGFGTDWRAGMAASTKLLQESLPSLGFANYDEFMTHAARTEFLSRQRHIRGSPDSSANNLGPIINECEELIQLRQNLNSIDEFFGRFTNDMKLITLNFASQANRLGESGRALSVVSQEISRSTTSIHNRIDHLQNNSQALNQALQNTSFNIALAALQLEMAIAFANERNSCSLNDEEQAHRYGSPLSTLQNELKHAAESSTTKALLGIQEIKTSLSHFGDFIESLGKDLLCIHVSHITGKTLTAGMSEDSTFNSLLEQLVNHADDARLQIHHLNDKVASSLNTVTGWSLR